jgi:hypothetical protein
VVDSLCAAPELSLPDSPFGKTGEDNSGAVPVLRLRTQLPAEKWNIQARSFAPQQCDIERRALLCTLHAQISREIKATFNFPEVMLYREKWQSHVRPQVRPQ